VTGPALPYPVVDPVGGDFQSAFRFVLGQELPVQDRKKPGRALQEAGPEGDVGIDPPAQREFSRRHPEMWREITRRLTENTIAALGEPGQPTPPENPRAVSAWKTFNANAARSVYADIWNASGAGRLPKPLALVYFDTAVQHGPGVAREMLRLSNGDPDTYLNLREELYRRLMTGPRSTRPVGVYHEVPARQRGWLTQRLPALRAAVAGMRDQETSRALIAARATGAR
jgi:hypothetical protein